VSKARVVIPILSFVVFFAAFSARGENKWHLSDLNPLDKSEAKAAPKSKSKSSFFKLPEWNWFGRDAKKNSRKKGPSAWEKLKTGVKNVIDKSKEALTPASTGKKGRGYSSIRERFQGVEKKDSGKSKSLFSSWFSNKEKPKKPKTVSEFLAQPRP
jgi:hypothetical protein